MKVLQLELDMVRKEWNLHLINTKKNSECIKGKPDVLYFSPESVNAEDKGLPIDETDVNGCINLYGRDKHPIGCSDDFLALLSLLLPNTTQPLTIADAISLYNHLIEIFATL